MPALSFPGSGYISTHAVLECPHTIDGDSGAFVVDAVISTAKSVNNSRAIVCSLVLIMSGEDMEFTSGVYDIIAKVHSVCSTHTLPLR